MSPLHSLSRKDVSVHRPLVAALKHSSSDLIDEGVTSRDGRSPSVVPENHSSPRSDLKCPFMNNENKVAELQMQIGAEHELKMFPLGG